MPRLLTIWAGLLMIAVIAAGPARADDASAASHGSATIAGAPALILGQTVNSSWSNQPENGVAGGEWWNVTLHGGDTLDVAIPPGAFSGCSSEAMFVDMYAPGVTDAGVGTVAPAEAGNSAVFAGQPDFTFTAPYSGTWHILFFTDCASIGYQYTATVTPSSALSQTGAATIAGAPLLTLGQGDATGWSGQPIDGSPGGEYWNVSLAGGDQLVIGIPTAAVSDCTNPTIGIRVYAPGITDATVSAAQLAGSGVSPKAQFTAPYNGIWHVQFNADCPTVSFPYEASIVPSAAAARGTGSATIATAPTLPVTVPVATGWSGQPVAGAAGGEWWNVGLEPGERVSVSAPTAGVADCVQPVLARAYAPNVTDTTVARVSALASGKAATFSFVASQAGVWHLEFLSACPTAAFPFVATLTPNAAPPPAPACVVPQLTGDSLPVARRALRQAHCTLGAVTRTTGMAKAAHVVAQGRPVGTSLAAHAKVRVTVLVPQPHHTRSHHAGPHRRHQKS